MKEEYAVHFQAIAEDPHTKLLPEVLRAVKRAERQQRTVHMLTMSFSSLLSFLALVPASLFFLTQMRESGIFSYLSLLFTDGGTTVSLWKEFAFTIIESLPITGTAAVLLALFALGFSLRATFKKSRTALVRFA